MVRTLIWNITQTEQTLPAVYGSAVLAAGEGYVVDATADAVVAALGGLEAINGIYLAFPISADTVVGAVNTSSFPQYFFDPALAASLGSGSGSGGTGGNGGGNTGPVSWTSVTGKPVFAQVATSGDYEDLINKPVVAALSDVAPPDLNVATAGTSAEASRANHTHAHGDQVGGTLHSVATVSDAGFMSAADKSKLDATPTDFFDGAYDSLTGKPTLFDGNYQSLTNKPTLFDGAYDSLTGKPTIPAVSSAAAADVGAAGAAGTSADAARADHVHAHGNQAGGALHAAATASAAGFMSSADKSKLDGIPAEIPALASTAPAPVGTANAVGTGTTAAKADHVHAHGAQTDATLHAAATTTANGFMSSADKTKLDSISRTYDFGGTAYGALTVGTLLATIKAARAFQMTGIVQGGGATVGVRLNGGASNVTFPQNVAINDVVTVVVSVAGTDSYFTVKAVEV